MAQKLSQQKAYSLTSGILLFGLGLFGFAFRSSFPIPDAYLLASLVLGFWGIVTTFTRS